MALMVEVQPGQACRAGGRGRYAHGDVVIDWVDGRGTVSDAGVIHGTHGGGAAGAGV